MSSEPQAHAVAEPDSSDAALVDSLLEALGASRVGLLAEFVRAYVRRVPALLVGELETVELAAHVAGLYAFMNERAPGELAVRAYNPETGTDGWHSAARWSRSASTTRRSSSTRSAPRCTCTGCRCARSCTR